MYSHSLPVENSAATRAGLLTYLARKLAPLFKGDDLRGQLADFLAPLGTAEITRALRVDPGETCERLTDALLRNSATRDAQTAAADVVACEFPHLSSSDRNRLAEFTIAVRDLATTGDGTITEHDFIRAGFGRTEAERLLPKSKRVQALLDGTAPPAPPASSAEAARRLIEAGVRAGLRFNPSALALSRNLTAA